MSDYGYEDIYDLRTLAGELRDHLASFVDTEETPDEDEAITILVDLAREVANTRQDMTPEEAADRLQEIGDSYEPTLIRDSYFQQYAEELAEDIGMQLPTEWPYRHIDWEAAAEELRTDYTSVTFNGADYWIRSW